MRVDLVLEGKKLTVLDLFSADELLREKNLRPLPLDGAVRDLVNNIAGYGSPFILLEGEHGTYLLTFPDGIIADRSPYTVEVESLEADTFGFSAYHHTYAMQAKIKTRVQSTDLRSFSDVSYVSSLKDTILFDKDDAVAVVRVSTVFLILIQLSFLHTAPPRMELWGLIARTRTEREEGIWNLLKNRKVTVVDRVRRRTTELTWQDFDSGPVRLAP